MMPSATRSVGDIAPTPSTNRRYAVWLYAATALTIPCLLAAQWLGLPDAYGSNVPGLDLATDHAWAIAFSVLLWFALFGLPIAREERLALTICWTAKCFVGLFAMLWYEDFYPFLDTFSYYDLGQGGFSYLAIADPIVFGDGSGLVTTMSALLSSLLPGGYHVHKQVFSAIGLAGIYCFYLAAKTVLGTARPTWLIGLGLFPSVLFWTSTLGKDPLVFLGIGLYCMGMAHTFLRFDLKAILLLGIGILMASFIRPWLALIMLLPAFVTVMVLPIGAATKAVPIMMVAVAISLLLGVTQDFFEVGSGQDALATVDALSRSWAEGGSGQVIAFNLANPVEYAAFLPLAIFTTLYRPLPGEIPSVYGLLSSLENMYLLGLSLLALLRLRWADFKLPAVRFCLLFLICWLIPYAPIAYQNLGTAVRFKLQILPLMLFLLLYYIGSADRRRSLFSAR